MGDVVAPTDDGAVVVRAVVVLAVEVLAVGVLAVGVLLGSQAVDPEAVDPAAEVLVGVVFRKEEAVVVGAAYNIRRR